MSEQRLKEITEKHRIDQTYQLHEKNKRYREVIRKLNEYAKTCVDVGVDTSAHEVERDTRKSLYEIRRAD